MAATHLSNNIRYEPDENPPLSVAIGTGIQSALVNLGGIVLGVIIGIVFAVLAFFPKATALLIAIPAPVAPRTSPYSLGFSSFRA